MENLKRALSWLVVFAAGLAPMLFYWVVGMILRPLRRKSRRPRSGNAPVQPRKKEGARQHKAAPPT